MLELAIDTARDPMLWFLVGTAALYGALGDWAEALVFEYHYPDVLPGSLLSRFIVRLPVSG